MHPDPAFAPGGADLLARAEAIGIAHVVAPTPDGIAVVHAPVTRHGDTLRFHCSRANRLHPHLNGAPVLLSLLGANGHLSPNWYAVPGNQVPTWNYVAVEIDGIARAIGEEALLDHLDRIAGLHEPRLNPWTRAKTDPAAIHAMLRAITGFEVEVTALRGTDKLSQNKPAADRARVAAALSAAGNGPLAALLATSAADDGPLAAPVSR